MLKIDSIKSRLFLLSTATLIISSVLFLGFFMSAHKEGQRSTIRETAEQVQIGVRNLIETKKWQIESNVSLIAVLPMMRAVLDTHDLPTIAFRIESYKKDLSYQIFEVFDAEGGHLKLQKESFQLTDELKVHISTVLSKTKAFSVLTLINGLPAIVTLAPVGIRDELSGVILVGNYINDSFAYSLKQLNNIDIAFFSIGDKLVAKSFAQELTTYLGKPDYEFFDFQIDTEANAITNVKLIFDVSQYLYTEKMLYRSTVFITAFVLLVLTLVAYFVSAQITKPLNSLSESVQRISNFRDLNTHNIPVEGTAEVKLLADSFNKMVSALHSTTVSKEYVENIIKSILDFLVVCDLGGVIRTFNRTVNAESEYREDDLVGKNINLLFGKTSYEVLDTLTKEGIVQNIESEITTMSGKKIPIRLSASYINQGVGTTKEILIIAKDVSFEKESEKIIEEQRVKMAQASKMVALGEMSGGIAHEINNPLTIISFSCDRINKTLKKYEQVISENQELAKLFDANIKIKETTERIFKIINGLLRFSREGLIDDLVLTPLHELIYDSTSLGTEKFKIHGIEFKIEYENVDRQDKINCARGQIAQVIVNLLNNAYYAVKKMDHAWVLLKCSKRESFFEISITDSGLGIPVLIRERLFEPFYTTKPLGDGTGLGLSISKGIVEKHGGTLTYDETSPNTRFVITLPS